MKKIFIEPTFLKSILIVLVLVIIGGIFYLWKQSLIVPRSERSKKDTSNIEFKLGEEFTLSKNEIGYYPTTDNYLLKLMITDFTNTPCPEDVVCIWSGLMVHYKLTVGNDVYLNPGNINEAPFTVFVRESDYQTYATFFLEGS